MIGVGVRLKNLHISSTSTKRSFCFVQSCANRHSKNLAREGTLIAVALLVPWHQNHGIKMTVFENIRKELEKIKEYLNLSKEEMDYILEYKAVHKDEIEVSGEKMDAWRIMHNDVLGPGKGGIRFHPNVTEDEVKSLAFWMSIKNSLLGLPFGGAKGGVRFNPKEVSEEELQEISREFVRKFHNHLGQDKDIPAPDVYTNEKIMSYMLDEFESIKGRHEPGMITGKPIELGGCRIRYDATSRGGVIILEEILKRKERKPEETSVAIQGFGNAGMNVAKMLHDKGYNVIALSDSSSGLWWADGLDVEAVIKHKRNTGKLSGFSNEISKDDIFGIDADVLILAALEDQITNSNVDEIKSGYVLELANGPVDFEADSILTGNGVIVIPDILANAGGVVASYCEWVQNKTGHLHKKENMLDTLNERMIKAFHSVYELHKEKGFSMRMAAYIIAVERILNAARLRGCLKSGEKVKK